MAIQLHVEIKGLDNQLKRLDNLDSGLQDIAPFLQQAGVALVESSQRNFEAGGRLKWAPLSMATVLLRAKGKAGYRENKRGENAGRVTKKTFDTYIAGAKPLRDTGLLMASIGNPSSQGIYRLEKNSITIGTAVKYAAVHQEGYSPTKGKIPGKSIPARPFLGADGDDRQRIYDMAVIFVQKRIDEASA